MPDSLARLISLQASEEQELQCLFANGLLWCYGFHHEEAQRHFRKLLALDSENLLGHWGLVHASAPFYNRPWSWYTDEQKLAVAELGYACTQKALTIENASAQAIGIELINALGILFSSPLPVSDEDYIDCQRSYAERMIELAQRYPDQADIATLAAEALMNCTPWRLWDTAGQTQASDSRVDEALALLQPFLADKHSADTHPGVLHLHIHALEMSPYPDTAANSAEKIRQLVISTQTQNAAGHSDTHLSPDTDPAISLVPPHLPHMASHIDVLQGNYRNTIDINRIAADCDSQIVAEEREFYQISRLHNVHMMLYAAMMAGRQTDAVDASQRLQALAASFYSTHSAPFLKVSIEGFYANCLHASIRFGRWPELSREFGDPRGKLTLSVMDSLPYVQAMQSYALGVALANSRQPDKAATVAERFQQRLSGVPAWYIVNNNPASDILSVASLMLAGEYHYHLGEVEQGLDYLRQAVAASDQLAYCEPRAWMHPPRHALGALLLEQNQLDEAKQVYETDLGLNGLLSRCQQNPKNIWALHGLTECYQRLEINAGSDHQQTLKEAVAYADITIKSSCFCRNAG